MMPTANAQVSSRLKTKKGEFIYIHTNNSIRDTEKGILQLDGDVQVVMGDRYISCDKATIYETTSEVEAIGNVRISNSSSYAEADRAKLNYANDTGTMYNAYIRSGKVYFEGAVIEKVGPEIYEADGGSYTTCESCPPAWKFKGSHIRAEMGGYAYIKHARMNFAFFPIPFYLPYLVVPLKSDRQTGLLTPEILYTSDSKWIYSQSYFWAINRSQDFTLTAKNYETRGPKLLGDYRYVLSPTSKGRGKAAIVRDKYFSGENSSFVGTERIKRWFLDYNHVYELPNGFFQRVKLSNASDVRYQRDFGDELGGYGDPSLENRVSLSRNSEATHASIDTSFYMNTLRANPYFDNRETVERAPEIKWSVKDQHVFNTPLLWNLNFNYVNFSRNDLAFDDVTSNLRFIPDNECSRFGVSAAQCAQVRTYCVDYPYKDQYDNPATANPVAYNPAANQPTDETWKTNCGFAMPKLFGKKFINTERSSGKATDGQGVFNPTQNESGVVLSRDIIRSGQRANFSPEVSLPITIGKYADIVPSVSYRLTQYAFDVNPAANEPFDTSPQRQSMRVQTSMRTRFSTILGDTEQIKSVRYKHEFQPEVIYTNYPWFTQTKSPFFNEKAKRPLFLEFQPVNDEDFLANRGIQFDYYDRFTNLNYLTLGFTNKLIRKGWPGSSAVYKQIVFMKTWTTYDIDEGAKPPDGPKFPWGDVANQLDIKLSKFTLSTLTRYYPYHNVTSVEQSAIRYSFTEAEYVGLHYSHHYYVSEDYRDTRFRAQDGAVKAEFGFRIPYLAVIGTMDLRPESYTPLTLAATAWSSEWVLRPKGNCWAMRLLYGQAYREDNLNSKWIESYKFSFDYNFGG